MKFKEWFYSELHRQKYTNDHPAFLAANEAWEAAHEACAKVCLTLNIYGSQPKREMQIATMEDCAAAIRARGEQQSCDNV